jgi:hypothetical protein
MSFFGNMNVGDKLRICFSDAAISERAISHVAAVYRQTDGVQIAEAVTLKETGKAENQRKSVSDL